MFDLDLLLIIIATYLIGALPFGYWLGLIYGVDLTKTGSGSTGATNVFRNIGKWQGIVVMLLDAFKGFLPIFYLKNFTTYFSDGNIYIALFLLFLPLFAHSKSIYIGFKGGKASATGLGVMLAVNWLVALITFAIWMIAVFSSGISSMGTLVSVPLVPFELWYFKEDFVFIVFSIIAVVFIVLIKHRTNIARLIKGEEYNFKNKSK